jgi:hypothetical protein
MTPLRLSDSELTTIFGLARPLAPEVRDVFLQDIAARLR